MTVMAALGECLAYVRTDGPAVDRAALTRRVELSGIDTDAWEPLLNSTPSALTLRSPTLQPLARVLTDEFDTWSAHGEVGFEAFIRARREHVRDVSREMMLAAVREATRPMSLLVVDPAASVFDGAAWVASNGYLDVNNVPPWDTWLLTLPPHPEGSRGRLVLCWVPEWAGDLVDEGIVVEPVSCLSWATLEAEAVRLNGWGQAWHTR